LKPERKATRRTEEHLAGFAVISQLPFSKKLVPFVKTHLCFMNCGVCEPISPFVSPRNRCPLNAIELSFNELMQFSISFSLISM
jgi:hypothetical protein